MRASVTLAGSGLLGYMPSAVATVLVMLRVPRAAAAVSRPLASCLVSSSSPSLCSVVHTRAQDSTQKDVSVTTAVTAMQLIEAGVHRNRNAL
jgi:hypothetical protein